jgi:hypothetical protein
MDHFFASGCPEELHQDFLHWCGLALGFGLGEELLETINKKREEYADVECSNAGPGNNEHGA